MPTFPDRPRSPAATRACILMCALAVLTLFLGGGSTYLSFIPFEKLPLELRQQLETIAHEIGNNITPQQLLTAGYRLMGIIALIIGTLMVIFGILVGLRNRIGTMMALGLVSLLLALSVLNLLVNFAGGQPAYSGCFLLIVVIPLGVLLYWLLAALRDLRTPHQGGGGNYSAQYNQYMQAMQNWYAQNSSGGYPTQPPPPPPAALPPPPPPSPENPPPNDPSANH
ncbi:MAG TPA: hypothetical protein VMD30_07035 [Tepidisphaeraceae bacterium]|nr:hypothetical protein [Tepidisphaeraceae bacterium]